MERYENGHVLSFSQMTAEVVFPIFLNRSFHYTVPPHLLNSVSLGIRVVCPFGPTPNAVGVIISLCEDSQCDIERSKMKEIKALYDKYPVFNFEKLKKIVKNSAIKWMAPQGMYYGLFFENVPAKESLGANLNLPDKDFLKTRKAVQGGFNPIWAAEKAQEFLKAGRSSLFLACDFLASVAVYKRLSEILGKENVFHYHGSLSKNKKLKISALLNENRPITVVGTKSAVFLPFRENSLFCMFKYEDPMYRQYEQNPFYDTADIVCDMAEIFSHELWLFYDAYRLEDYERFKNEFSRSDEVPQIKKDIEYKVINSKENNFLPLSSKALNLCAEAFEKKEKVIVACNAKGLAFKTFCPICAWTMMCQDCQKPMRLFKEDDKTYYKCSYCLKKADFSEECPKCKAKLLKNSGYGVQKVAEFLLEKFPDKKIIVLDSDNIKKSVKGAEDIYKTIVAADFDALVGTAMILDRTVYPFEFSAAILHSLRPETYHMAYKESEWALSKIISASLLVKDKGVLFAETFEPENIVFSYGLDYEKFSKSDLDAREFFKYPPFCEIMAVEFLSKQEAQIRDFVLSFSAYFTEEKKAQYKIMEYRHTEKIRLNRKTGIYSHKNFFKTQKNAFSLREYLLNLEKPKGLKLNFYPDEF